MRIIVLSDTHRNYAVLETIFARHPDADLFVHLGDGEEELDCYLAKYPHRAPKIWHVQGNCDRMSLSPPRLTLDLPFGHRLFAAHGHNESVKYSTSPIRLLAQKEHADIILFGHTHERYEHYEDGIYFLNPGSASCPRDGFPPSYGSVEVTEAGVLTAIIPVNPRTP